MIAARKTDTETITLSREDFTALARNGSANVERSNLKEWIRLTVICLIPLITLITLFSRTSFQVEQNQNDIAGQRVWMGTQSSDTQLIKGSLSVVAAQQAVIVEKVSRIQKDIEKLNHD